MKMLKILKKADLALAFVLKCIAIGLCLTIAFILMGRVILRLPFFKSSMAWSEEIVELTMAWMILTMSTLLFRSGEHFRVELLEKKYCDRPFMKVVHLLITLVNLTFIGMLLFYGIKFMLPKTQFSPILKINHRFYYAGIPVNAALILLYLIRDLVRDILAFRKPADPQCKQVYRCGQSAEAAGTEETGIQ